MCQSVPVSERVRSLIVSNDIKISCQRPLVTIPLTWCANQLQCRSECEWFSVSNDTKSSHQEISNDHASNMMCHWAQCYIDVLASYRMCDRQSWLPTWNPLYGGQVFRHDLKWTGEMLLALALRKQPKSSFMQTGFEVLLYPESKIQPQQVRRKFSLAHSMLGILNSIICSVFDDLLEYSWPKSSRHILKVSCGRICNKQRFSISP